MNPSVNSIDVEGVSVVYPNGHQALNDASFRLGAGTICALVGVNGSGKSTLFKSIMGFVNPTAGRVRINGMPVKDSLKNTWSPMCRSRRKSIGSFP